MHCISDVSITEHILIATLMSFRFAYQIYIVNMIAPEESLLKYDYPVLVCKDSKKSVQTRSFRTTQQQFNGSKTKSVTAKPKPPSLNMQQTVDTLNKILPPRVWTENGELWRQQVSSEPCTRFDVVELQNKLDRNLEEKPSMDLSICPIRRELFYQCFDELIRQVTIICCERGLLLARVFDEIKMTIDTYQTLYESSFAFCMRKALQVEQENSDMEKMISELENEKMEMEKQLNEQQAQQEATERKEMELRKAEEKKHTDELQSIRRENQRLSVILEEIIAEMK